MESDLDSSQLAAFEDPQRLTIALEEHGWKFAGGRRGEYATLQEPGDLSSRHARSLVIPLDKESPEYREDMLSILSFLSGGNWIDLWTRKIAPKLTLGAMDIIKLRKEVGAPAGLIPWRVGEDFVLSARNIIVAGAKSYMSKERQYRNRHGQFANRYLESVMMGQTEPGSYILSAYTPTSHQVPLRSEAVSRDTLGLPNIDFVYTSEVTNSIVSSIEAVTEALEHYRRRGSDSGFSEGVSRGISYELTRSLAEVVAGAEESDISFELSRSPERPSTEAVHAEFLFRPSDAEVLNRVAERFLKEESQRGKTSVIGTVHLLSRKERDSPGTVGIEVWSGADVKRVRVTIETIPEYHEAVIAHDSNEPVEVVGYLERDGNIWRLNDASLARYKGFVSRGPDDSEGSLF
ncbi:hypothetical protein [Nocardia cyriacigeorgica]|jgi:hypothetical protein|uniref:hypothetical protein n=2 Tax=Nocardia cyriacigeorgica TaxID=135487 RepID=UPI0011B0DCFE|nr:hypothetical protein [Nocardia cyriacigeorgica]MBF6322348.1 hypothetical protein [Nocardia cyriacigeorgica]